MCGRFFLSGEPDKFRSFYGYAERPNFPPRYNVAPTQPVAVVIVEGGERHFRLMRWGFWPGWLKDPRDFPLVFNARSETIAEKASFKGALRHRRCVFLADGFYEWRRDGEGSRATRTPFAIRRADGEPLALAGLWETWASPDGSEVDTAAIITTSANGTLAAVHERMPVILSPDALTPWLDALAATPAEALKLCRPCPDVWLRLDPVGPRVNDARNDDADLIEPVGRATPAPKRDALDPDEGSAQGDLF